MIYINSNLLNIFKSININKIASSATSTLNVVKKIIPVYKEVRPLLNKNKNIFDKEEKNERDINETHKYNDSLTFFH